MSLPTYIRKRRVANPVDYISQHLAAEGRPTSPAEIHRFMQLLRGWERDYEGYYINPVKRHVRPFWLIPTDSDEQIVSLAAAGTPGDEVKKVQFVVDTQGHFEIAYSMFEATDPNFLVIISDGGNNEAQLMNREIHATTISADAKRPFIWPETYFLNVQNAPRTVFMNFRNLSSSPNNVRWAFHGRRWYHKEAPALVQQAIEERFARMEKTYTYFLTVEPTRAGGRPPDIILTPSQALQENSAPFFRATDEADTEVYKLMVFAQFADGSDGQFTFALREQQSGRILANGQVSNSSGWGTGAFPFILPETFLFERNYVLLFEVTNLSSSQNLTIFPTLCGRRLQYA